MGIYINPPIEEYSTKEIFLLPEEDIYYSHIELKQILNEGAKELAIEDFLKNLIKGTEWEGKVFIAGGYVRDFVMGKDPKTKKWKLSRKVLLPKPENN
jgi:hypothetical protein